MVESAGFLNFKGWMQSKTQKYCALKIFFFRNLISNTESKNQKPCICITNYPKMSALSRVFCTKTRAFVVKVLSEAWNIFAATLVFAVP